MTFTLSFPTPRRKLRILTGMMKMASRLTLEAHCNHGLVMWSGGVGRGKTSCAEWMVDELNTQYDPQNPESFRLKHYEIGGIQKWKGRADKVALRSMYHAIVGPMDEGVYRTFPAEAIAEMIVYHMRSIGYQIVFVDEAGRLCLEALDALVLVSNTAGIMGWPLTIVIIGMDDLPIKITLNKRIYSRVYQKVCFQPYSMNETWDLLAALEPHFDNLRRDNKQAKQAKEQVALIHELCGGNPREITSFISRFAGIRREHTDMDIMVAIRSAHQQPTREENRIREDMGLTGVKKYKGRDAGKKGKKKGKTEKNEDKHK